VIESYEKKELIPYFSEVKRDYSSGSGLTMSEYSVHRLIKKNAKEQK